VPNGGETVDLASNAIQFVAADRDRIKADVDDLQARYNRLGAMRSMIPECLLEWIKAQGFRARFEPVPAPKITAKGSLPAAIEAVREQRA